MRLSLFVLLASTAPLPASLAAQMPHLILHASADVPDTVDLDPIVFSDDGALRAVDGGDEDSASVAFRAKAYAPGAAYWLYSGGRRIGRAMAIGADEYGCTGLPGTATPQQPLHTGWSGLAASDSTLSTLTRRRELVLDEKSKLSVLALGELRKLAPAIHPSALDISDAWGVELPSHAVWLVATFRAVPVADTADEMFSAMVVLERGLPRVVPPLVWSHFGGEESRQERRAIDILDLDHDGTPELITSTSYYESQDYQIWRRTPSGWSLWMTSGGSGC